MEKSEYQYCHNIDHKRMENKEIKENVNMENHSVTDN